MRHLAVMISVALLSAGAADFHASTPVVAPTALPFASAWTREFAGAPPSTAAVADSGWLVAGFTDHLEFVSIESGERVATLPVPGPQLACGATLCIAGDDQFIRAIDVATRTVRWQRPSPAALSAPPVLRNGWVFVTTRDGHVAAWREVDGTVVWTHAAGAPLTGPVSVDGTRVALATTREDVQLIDVATGRVVWTTPVDGGLPGAPKLGGGGVYVGTASRGLQFLDAVTGRLAAPQRTGATIVGAPALDERYIYTTGQDGVLRAFDRGNHALRWYADLPTRPSVTGPVAGDDLVVVALRTGAFQGYLSTSDGKKPAFVIASPSATDATKLLQIPPIVAGSGRTMRLVTISVTVGDSAKWSATVFSAAGRIELTATPAMVSGLGLALTPPR